MQAICLVADSLDDPDTLVDALKKLGQSHAKRHIKVEQFRVSSLVSRDND